jgi:hypothetical protein
MKWRGLEVIVAGNKLYVICAECGKMVQINKFILGGLHFCEKE